MNISEKNIPTDPPLFTRSFVALMIANLLIFSSFYVLITILPTYLKNELQVSPIISGVILSLYTLAGLVFRPFAGFISDLYKGKTLYLVSLLLFVLPFLGYLHQGGVLYLLLLRVIHGIAFSLVTTASTACILEIIPREKLGRGLGFFGVSAALSMALGPTLGYFALGIRGSFFDAFLLSVGIAGLALAVSFLMQPITAKRPEDTRLNIKNLFLPVVKKPFIAFIGIIFPYALTIAYLALLITEKNMPNEYVAYVFLGLASGITISRAFAGRLIDGGRLKQTIVMSSIACFFCYPVFFFSSNIYVFMVTVFIVGIGNGAITPAYQTIFATLVPPTQRGRASSLFFTAFDLGVGLAMLVGGAIAHYKDLSYSFLLGSLLLFIALWYFVVSVWPFYSSHVIKNE